MSPPLLARALLLAAALSVAGPLAAGSAQAFSQIGQGDGRSTSKEGIISVPLPPLPSAADGETGQPQDETGPADEWRPDGARPVDEIGAPEGTGADTQPTAAPPAADDERTDEFDDADVPAQDGLAPADDGTGGTATPLAGGALLSNASESRSGANGTLAPTDVAYGDANLPAPVRDLRRRLIDIARSGEIEALRPYIETGEDGTTLSFGDGQADPIAFLREVSGDADGAEILAILLEVLESGHVHADPGTEAEIFVWPYFTRIDIAALTKPQKVELFELVTAGDYEAMKSFGAYNFYRAGITPDGRLQFFVAGD